MNPLRYFLAIVRDSDGRIFQIVLELNRDDVEGEYAGPIKCSVSASAQKFWRNKLHEFDVDMVSRVTPLPYSPYNPEE